jgi:hypothetical protein
VPPTAANAPVLGQRSSEYLGKSELRRWGLAAMFRAILSHRPGGCATQFTFQIRSGISPTQVGGACGGSQQLLFPAPSLRSPRFIRSLRGRLAGSCAVLRRPLTHAVNGQHHSSSYFCTAFFAVLSSTHHGPRAGTRRRACAGDWRAYWGPLPAYLPAPPPGSPKGE